jgi:uncharacterized protein YciI
VDFLVLGRDHDDFDGHSPELNERHWSYLEEFADRLVARGPLLSDAGEHTGSVHIVALPDRAAALAFARDEPYWRAGLYASVEVAGFRNLLGVTMWQRERLPGSGLSWLTLLRVAHAREALAPGSEAALASELRADRSVVFCGLLLDETATGATGLVAGFDAASPALPRSAETRPTRRSSAGSAAVATSSPARARMGDVV